MEDFLNTGQAEDLPMAESSFTAYHWSGPGETILFMHGWRSNSARWKQLIQYFAEKEFNLVTIDAPGHGSTALPTFSPLDYAECLELTIRKYNPQYLICHSVGAYTALIHYGKYKPTGLKYILLAPTYSMHQPIGTMFEILHLNRRLQKAYIKFLEKKMGDALETIQADHLVDENYPQGILIHDINDKILPIEGSRALAKTAKGLKFIEIENKGHRMQNDQVHDLIKSFVNPSH